MFRAKCIIKMFEGPRFVQICDIVDKEGLLYRKLANYFEVKGEELMF